jgi:hypothetical protein
LVNLTRSRANRPADASKALSISGWFIQLIFNKMTTDAAAFQAITDQASFQASEP